MGRPTTHTPDDFLDAAVRLFAEGGTRAMSMSAVAKAIGAPSGSIYHRFADRQALLAAVWQRTARGFESTYWEALGSESNADTAIAAAVWVVDWCRSHLDEAVVLQAGRLTFMPDDDPEEVAADRARNRALAKVVADVAAQTGLPRDEVAFAMLELPMGVIRPHLVRREAPPGRARDLVRRLATRVLTDKKEAGS